MTLPSDDQFSDLDAEFAALVANQTLEDVRRQFVKNIQALTAAIQGFSEAAKSILATEATEFEAIAINYDDGWDIIRDCGVSQREDDAESA